jgi:predicted lipase
VGNTQAYLATNDEHIVVAFRGTESPTSIDGLKDWLLNDALNLLILPEGDLGTDFVAAGVGARFHQGFMKALADIWDPLYEAVQAERKKSDRPLWLTGHSLGGALAVLAAWRFKRKFVPVHQVYTFGGPMVGNDIAAKAIDRELGGRIFRYVNLPDPVPLLPSVSLIANHYAHCESEVSLGAAAESFVESFKEKAGKTVDGLLNATLIEDIWKSLQERVSAHFMDNYRRLVGELKR